MTERPSNSVVVIHGALGSAGQMAPLADALVQTRAFARVITVELPGHGDTPLPHGVAFTMELLARHIGEQITHAGVHRPVVFGYSMGGYAALLLEHLAPGTVGGIVTLGTMLAWTPEVASRGAARLDARVLREKVPAFADALAARHAGAGGWEPMLERTASLLHSLGASPPLTDAVLSGIHCPVHLLVGDRDDSVTLDETSRAASQLPRARASLLPDTPHPIEKVSLPVIVQEVRDLAAQLHTGV